MRLKACGDCDPEGNCLSGMSFDCGYSGGDYQYSESYYSYSSYNFTCGCSNFINNVSILKFLLLYVFLFFFVCIWFISKKISYIDVSTDDECFSSALAASTALTLIEIMGIISGSIRGFVLIIASACIFREDRKRTST